MSLKNNEILERFRELLSNVSIKTYLYGIGAVAMIILIIWNAHQNKSYIVNRPDGKIDLQIDKVAKDYGLDISSDNSDNANNTDYVNSDSNLTNDLSQSLFLTAMYLDQNGVTDPTAKGQILANIIYDYQKQAQAKVYTNTDLNIIRGTDSNSIQDYYKSISQAISSYQSSLNEVTISDDSNTKDLTEQNLINFKGSITADILKIIDIDNNFINNLLSIPATSDGSVYQLQLINLISEQNVFLKSLAYIDTDPMKYILNNGGDFQQKFTSDMTSILNAFNDYFKKSGVKF